MIDHAISIEYELPDEPFALECNWQPVPVVFPHPVVGNVADVAPEGKCLVGFNCLSGPLARKLDMNVNTVAVAEQE